MKKVILCAFFTLAVLGADAQQGTLGAPGSNTPAGVGATGQDIRQLAAQLQLNEAQYIRLRELIKAREEQIAEINSQYANDLLAQQARLRAAQQQFEAQLSQAITEKQFAVYQQMQGRSPGTPGAAYQAGGYGGRSLENTAVSGAADPAPANPQLMTEPLDTNIDQGQVEVTKRVVKVENEEGEMKIKARKEKVETPQGEYKADRDETKFKARDKSIKVKSEKGKTKVETPEGKVKLENGAVKVKPKQE